MFLANNRHQKYQDHIYDTYSFWSFPVTKVSFLKFRELSNITKYWYYTTAYRSCKHVPWYYVHSSSSPPFEMAQLIIHLLPKKILGMFPRKYAKNERPLIPCVPIVYPKWANSIKLLAIQSLHSSLIYFSEAMQLGIDVRLTFTSCIN